MTSKLRNPKYYRGAFSKIRKFMEVREEGMEVHEEAVQSDKCNKPKQNKPKTILEK